MTLPSGPRVGRAAPGEVAVDERPPIPPPNTTLPTGPRVGRAAPEEVAADERPPIPLPNTQQTIRPLPKRSRPGRSSQDKGLLPGADERPDPSARGLPPGRTPESRSRPSSDNPRAGAVAAQDGVAGHAADDETSAVETDPGGAAVSAGDGGVAASPSEPKTALPVGDDDADAADTGEDRTPEPPASPADPSAVEQTTPKPVPSTWSGLGRTGPLWSGATPSGSDAHGVGGIGGPSLPDDRALRRPRRPAAAPGSRPTPSTGADSHAPVRPRGRRLAWPHLGGHRAGHLACLRR